MTPAKLTLESFTAGDTWDGIPALTIRVNGVAPAPDISLVKMRFAKADRTGGVPVELSSAVAGQITITNANNWEVSIPGQLMPGLTAGRWLWRIRITDSTGAKRTYLADEITVLEDA